MPWLTLHLERQHGNDTWVYTGTFEQGSGWALLHVLGFPGGARFAPVNDVQPLKSWSGLPKDVTSEMRRIETETPLEDAAWRWAWFSAIDAYVWDMARSRREVAGPIDYQTYVTTGTLPKGPTLFDDDEAADLARRGFKRLSNDEMAQLIQREPSLLEDELQMVGRVYTVLESRTTLANELEFRDALMWLRASATGRSERVIMWGQV